MPKLSVWAVRSALAHLALGFTFGALMLAEKGLTYWPESWRMLPAHIEFLLFGWTVQFVMGVGFWILPRLRQAPRRGNVRLAWTAVVLLNLGVWLAGLGATLALPSWVIGLGRGAETLAAASFAAYAWPRVRPTITGNRPD